MARACNEKRTRKWGEESIRDASEREKEPRKTKTEGRDVIARDMKQNRIEDGAWKDRNNWRKVCRAADPV